MLKVFLAEDEVIVREALRDSIPWETCGFTFSGEAPDGETALEMVRSIHPDLILTDIKMPFMDGLTFARHVREELPETKIIFISGYDDFEYARQAIEVQADQYLLKPVTRAELVSALGKARERIEEEQHRRSLLEQLAQGSGESMLEAPSGKSGGGEIVEDALRYIDAHYCEESISLNTVAKAINVSANYLSAVFSQRVGSSFIEYLTGKRIQKAKQLLRQTDRRSGEIAFTVGYRDPRYFSSVFKKQQGCTPSEYRSREGDTNEVPPVS